jgi:UDP-2-acetamido-3-amino-2,3-dideoxy-glucuronate N-acetyltransferase
LSVILSLAGHQLPEQVCCTGEAYLRNGVADITLTALKFAGGVRAHVYVSWLNPFKEQKLTVVGSNGLLVFDDTQPWGEKLMLYRQHLTWTNGQVPTPNRPKGEPVAVPESEPLRAECEHFLFCCDERRLPRTDGFEGCRVLHVLQAAQRSLDRDGAVVALAEPTGNGAEQAAGNGNGEGRIEPVRISYKFGPAVDYYAHPTAVVDEGAQIGRYTKIWHFSHIMKGAQIGELCVLGQNVNVAGGATLGNNVKVQNNVSIYTGVVVEDDVFLGPSCVLTNVTNPRSQVNRQRLYEPTVIRRGATVGAHATVLCGITLGRYAFIGAGAVVTEDVPDYALMLGTPARQKGWMSRHGHLLRNPNKAGVMSCPESGYRYQVDGEGQLKCLDLDEEAPLPSPMAVGGLSYAHFRKGDA